MFKILFFILILFIPHNAFGHMKHYKDIKTIKMDIVKDGKIIGFCNYSFYKKNNKINVKNVTQFNVKIFGVEVFSILSNSLEVYENDKLVLFESKTSQNKKKKYVNLVYSKELDKYLIKGSSYVGKADIDNIVGNWWNHKLLTAEKQISPLSGSIKDQVVTFLNKENLNLYGKNYIAHKFSLKSKDSKTPDNKKLDFIIWLEPQKNIILKVSYKKMGLWEYVLKDIISN